MPYLVLIQFKVLQQIYIKEKTQYAIIEHQVEKRIKGKKKLIYTVHQARGNHT